MPKFTFEVESPARTLKPKAWQTYIKANIPSGSAEAWTINHLALKWGKNLERPHSKFLAMQVEARTDLKFEWVDSHARLRKSILCFIF